MYEGSQNPQKLEINNLILIVFSGQSKKSEKSQNSEFNTETEIIKPKNIVLNNR